MLVCNAAFHKYDLSEKAGEVIEFPDSLSINAGVFAAVLLASRLARFVNFGVMKVIGRCFV